MFCWQLYPRFSFSGEKGDSGDIGPPGPNGEPGMASRVQGFLNMYLKIALLENITREIKWHEAGKCGACADVTPSVTRSPGVATLPSLHARPSDRGRRPSACTPGAAQSGVPSALPSLPPPLGVAPSPAHQLPSARSDVSLVEASLRPAPHDGPSHRGTGRRCPRPHRGPRPLRCSTRVAQAPPTRRVGLPRPARQWRHLLPRRSRGASVTQGPGAAQLPQVPP